MWFPHHLYFTHYSDRILPVHFPFARNIKNSVIVASVTTVVCLVLGTFAAYALAKLPLPAKKAILILVVTMVTFPGIALVASLFLYLQRPQFDRYLFRADHSVCGILSAVRDLGAY